METTKGKGNVGCLSFICERQKWAANFAADNFLKKWRDRRRKKKEAAGVWLHEKKALLL
jgi:hypothetical protein